MTSHFYCTDASHNRVCCYECSRDAIEALRERIRTLEAGIEREAVWCEEIAGMDIDPDEAADSNSKRAARLRALLK